jgi:hypothetical protein
VNDFTHKQSQQTDCFKTCIHLFSSSKFPHRHELAPQGSRVTPIPSSSNLQVELTLEPIPSTHTPTPPTVECVSARASSLNVVPRVYMVLYPMIPVIPDDTAPATPSYRSSAIHGSFHRTGAGTGPWFSDPASSSRNVRCLCCDRCCDEFCKTPLPRCDGLDWCCGFEVVSLIAVKSWK